MTSKMQVLYGREKLGNAVSGMMASGEPLRTRLTNALFEIQILSGPAGASHLPDSIRDEFNRFYESMSSQPAVADEGMIAATVRTLDDTQLRVAAENILEFYTKTVEYLAEDF